MNPEPGRIEERLIPYIEGVLTEAEHLEVGRAIAADPQLALEVQQLEEIISDLRLAFAAGVEPYQEELTPEEVVMLASHRGSLDSMPGSSELKTRLFNSDRALAEYELLRSLSQELTQTTLPIDDVPEMPESLLAEFRSLQKTGKKVVPLPTTSPTERRNSLIDRINPRPLMAIAAVLALFSIGFLLTDKKTPTSTGTTTADTVASSAPLPLSPDIVDGGMGAPARSTTESSSMARTASEPGGVAIFTSDDRDLLKEQAEKLLAGKVRYTVAGDQILVAEKEADVARRVLWGEDEPSPEESSKPLALTRPASPPPPSSDISRVPLDSESDEDDGTLTVYTPGGTRTISRSELSAMTEGQTTTSGPGRSSASTPPATSQAPSPTRVTPSPALSTSQEKPEKSSQSRPPLEDIPPFEDLDPKSSQPLTAETYREQREQRLRDLALSDSDDANQAAHTEPLHEDPPTPQEVNPISEPEPIDSAAPAHTTKSSAAAATAPPVLQSSSASVTRQSTEPKDSVDSGMGMSASSTSDYSLDETDLRLADIESVRARVARELDISISTQMEGDSISVLVRASRELSKGERDELRQQLRERLGLTYKDSIIFR